MGEVKGEKVIERRIGNGGGGYNREGDSRNWGEGSGRMGEKETKEKDEQVEERRALE